MSGRVGQFRSVRAKQRYLTAYDNALADLPAPTATLDVPTRFGTVRVYRFTGDDDADEPMVLLPGQSSGTPVWGKLMPGFLRRSVYALDLLGQPGRSIQDAPITSAAGQAAWLGDVLHTLPEPRLHLFGLSIGGWHAMNLATRDRDGIASVAVIDSPFVFGMISVQLILRSLPLALPWTPDSWREKFTSWTAGGIQTGDVAVARMIEAGLAGYAPAAPTFARPSEADLRALGLPVFVVAAGDSGMHDPGTMADNANRLLPNGRVTTYEGASHAVAYEETERLHAEYQDFLTSIA